MKGSAEFWMRIVIVVSFLALIIYAPAILFPFILSLIIAILLTPAAKRIHSFLQGMGMKWVPYDGAIILSFALFIAVIYFISVHILVPFIAEFRQFARSVPDMINAVQISLADLEGRYQLRLLPPEMQNLISQILQNIGEYTLRIAQLSLSAIFSIASTIIQLIVVPFITFYMMKKGDQFVQKFIHLFPDRYTNHLELLFQEIYFVLNAYIRGQLLLSILIGAVVFLGMWFMDIPYPLVIGLLAAVVEMVPLIGPIIGAIPPILLGLMQGTAVMVQIIVFYVIVQQLDGHFVMPKLMGSIIDVHPVAIMAGVLIGGHVFGIVGMMLSVPLVAVLQVVLRHMWFYDRYRSLK